MNRSELVSEMEALLGPAGVSSGREQLRTYECDGLTSYRVVPELVVLPETTEQVRLHFPTLEAALAYAAKNGLDAHVVPAPQPRLKIQAYADNFR